MNHPTEPHDGWRAVPTAAGLTGLSRHDLEGADALRFWAALSIILYHALLLPGIEPPGSFWVIRNFGGFGVPLFFALSAFVLCHGYHGRLDTAEAVRSFYLRRLFRIAPLFYLVGAVSLAFFYAAYGRGIGMADLVTSATFTFGLFPQHHQGFVWASWSIGVEMLFYAIFPLLTVVVRSWRSATVAFIGAAGIAAALGPGLQGSAPRPAGLREPRAAGTIAILCRWHARLLHLARPWR